MSEETIKEISEICDWVKATLIQRNKTYGDSFMSPINIYARVTPLQSMEVMNDIKLSRLANGAEAVSQIDTVLDVMGYAVLLIRVIREVEKLPKEQRKEIEDMSKKIRGMQEELVNMHKKYGVM